MSAVPHFLMVTQPIAATVGHQIEDEAGWRIVVSVEQDGVWTMDKHGAEHFERGV